MSNLPAINKPKGDRRHQFSLTCNDRDPSAIERAQRLVASYTANGRSTCTTSETQKSLMPLKNTFSSSARAAPSPPLPTATTEAASCPTFMTQPATFESMENDTQNKLRKHLQLSPAQHYVMAQREDTTERWRSCLLQYETDLREIVTDGIDEPPLTSRTVKVFSIYDSVSRVVETQSPHLAELLRLFRIEMCRAIFTNDRLRLGENGAATIGGAVGAGEEAESDEDGEEVATYFDQVNALLRENALLSSEIALGNTRDRIAELTREVERLIENAKIYESEIGRLTRQNLHVMEQCRKAREELEQVKESTKQQLADADRDLQALNVENKDMQLQIFRLRKQVVGGKSKLLKDSYRQLKLSKMGMMTTLFSEGDERISLLVMMSQLESRINEILDVYDNEFVLTEESGRKSLRRKMGATVSVLIEEMHLCEQAYRRLVPHHIQNTVTEDLDETDGYVAILFDRKIYENLLARDTIRRKLAQNDATNAAAGAAAAEDTTSVTSSSAIPLDTSQSSVITNPQPGTQSSPTQAPYSSGPQSVVTPPSPGAYTVTVSTIKKPGIVSPSKGNSVAPSGSGAPMQVSTGASAAASLSPTKPIQTVPSIVSYRTGQVTMGSAPGAQSAYPSVRKVGGFSGSSGANSLGYFSFTENAESIASSLDDLVFLRKNEWIEHIYGLTAHDKPTTEPPTNFSGARGVMTRSRRISSALTTSHGNPAVEVLSNWDVVKSRIPANLLMQRLLMNPMRDLSSRKFLSSVDIFSGRDPVHQKHVCAINYIDPVTAIKMPDDSNFIKVKYKCSIDNGWEDDDAPTLVKVSRVGSGGLLTAVNSSVRAGARSDSGARELQQHQSTPQLIQHSAQSSFISPQRQGSGPPSRKTVVHGECLAPSRELSSWGPKTTFIDELIADDEAEREIMNINENLRVFRELATIGSVNSYTHAHQAGAISSTTATTVAFQRLNPLSPNRAPEWSLYKTLFGGYRTLTPRMIEFTTIDHIMLNACERHFTRMEYRYRHCLSEANQRTTNDQMALSAAERVFRDTYILTDFQEALIDELEDRYGFPELVAKSLYELLCYMDAMNSKELLLGHYLNVARGFEPPTHIHYICAMLYQLSYCWPSSNPAEEVSREDALTVLRYMYRDCAAVTQVDIYEILKDYDMATRCAPLTFVSMRHFLAQTMLHQEEPLLLYFDSLLSNQLSEGSLNEVSYDAYSDLVSKYWQVKSEQRNLVRFLSTSLGFNKSPTLTTKDVACVAASAWSSNLWA